VSATCRPRSWGCAQAASGTSQRMQLNREDWICPRQSLPGERQSSSSGPSLAQAELAVPALNRFSLRPVPARRPGHGPAGHAAQPSAAALAGQRVWPPVRSNFGGPTGQSQQLMFNADLPCGAAIAKLLSGGPRQSKQSGAPRQQVEPNQTALHADRPVQRTCCRLLSSPKPGPR
jgi:hypothetical protein